jgi:hypothetical protein
MAEEKRARELAVEVAREIGGKFWESHRLNRGLILFISRLDAESSKAKEGQTAPDVKCPSCGGSDNNPYEAAFGIRMRACGRCMIQWVAEPQEDDFYAQRMARARERQRRNAREIAEPTGQAQADICPRCESHYRNFKTLHCIADPHKWHSEEGREWPRQAQEAPKDITEDLYNCNTDVKE